MKYEKSANFWTEFYRIKAKNDAINEISHAKNMARKEAEWK
jgi:hypothetical protein